jgi:phosphoribosyl 1,2-cyclic phosphodiesterase
MLHSPFTIHGARGSSPTAAHAAERYGGHTTCFSVEAGTDGVVIVDAGTAIAFSPSLLHHTRFHIFFTHFHLDHIQGLPFFGPIYQPDTEFVFYGNPPAGTSLVDAIGGVFRPPWFPVDLRDTPCAKEFVDLSSSPQKVGDVSLSTAALNHPQGCTAYRLERSGRSIVVATDHEAGDDAVDGGLGDLADGADVLLHDGQYTADEYAVRVGWGHSTWEAAAAAASRAHVGELVLTSHDPSHTDAQIDAMVAGAAERFEHVRGAEPGLWLEL